MEIENNVQLLQENINNLKKEIAKVIVGNDQVIDNVIVSIFAGGHILFEGVPGVGKTLLVKTLSQCLNLKFSRIQFTPDLMPADVTGTNIINLNTAGEKAFEFRKGPLFGNIILADEINRATPKTQSALLEAMQEGNVTISDKTYPLPEPFFVIATQNPIEMEGTYPLPEAQLDRFFFKVNVKIPDLRELMAIVDRTTRNTYTDIKQISNGKEIVDMSRFARSVPIASHVVEYVGRLILATHPTTEGVTGMVKKYIRYGSSPRGAQALVIAAKIVALMKGRYNVSFSDIRTVAIPALCHRLILNFEGETEGIKTEQIIEHIMEQVPETT